MAKTSAERMARLRARQRRAGLTTVSLVVPQDEAAGFIQLAKRRRTRSAGGPGARALVLPRHITAAGSRSAISSKDVMQLRALLEVTALGLVIERMNATVERRLRGALAREASLDGDAASPDLQRFHATMGELAADPTLRFLLRIALRLTEDHSSFAGRPKRDRDAVVERIKRFHVAIVEAMVARNQPLAERHMRRYLGGLEDWLE